MFKWEKDVKLVTSRFFLYDVLRVSVLSYILINVLLLVMALFVDGGRSWNTGLLVGSGLAVIGLAIAILIIALLFFGNKIPYRFTATDKVASMEMMSRKAKVANRLSSFLGILTGKPGVAGAGAIAASREYTELPWKWALRAKYYPGAKTITLLNGWRAVIRFYCTEENYQEVADFVKLHVDEDNKANLKKEQDEKMDFKVASIGFSKICLMTIAAWLCLLSPFAIPEWIILTSWVMGILMVLTEIFRPLTALVSITGFLATIGFKLSAGLQVTNVFEDFQANTSYRPRYADYSGFGSFDNGDWFLFMVMIIFTLTAIGISINSLRTHYK